MNLVRAIADPAHPEGGHAILLLPGVMRAPADPRFRILREGWVKGTLGPDGWQVGDALLRPDRVEETPEGLRLYLGPRIVDWLEAGPVIFRLPAAGVDAALFWPDIPPLHGGSGHTIAEPPPPAPTLPPRPAAPPPADPDATVALAPRKTPVAGTPAPPSALAPAATAKRARLWLWLPLLLLVAGGGGGAYWWLASGAAPQPAGEAPGTSAQPPNLPPLRPRAEAEAPASLAGLSVPEVIARASSPAAIAEEAARRYEAGRHDDALLLWEAAARAGYAPALTRLAGLYDPVGFQPGRPFRDPDPRQAARHYRDAVMAGDAAAAQPRARLRQWLEDRAREGDMNAPLTLRDFWP